MSQTNETSQQAVKTILIVEDDTDIGTFLVQALAAETVYHALLAPNGVQAIKHAKTLIPDLFILDYQLPRMNGLELYDHLHAQETLQHIPALFMSANAPVNEIEKRHARLIKKPFELDELLQMVQGILDE
jgi:CheY-like chemotaxis protein